MSKEFFSTKERGFVEPSKGDISPTVFNGIIGVFNKYKVSMSANYPIKCPDSEMIIGFDEKSFRDHMISIIPTYKLSDRGWIEPLDVDHMDFDMYAILDFIEFCWENIKDYQPMELHSYFSHIHLQFYDGIENKIAFVDDINRIFHTNGIVFKMNEAGSIERILPLGLDSVIKNYCHSGKDTELNKLIDLSIQNITKPKPEDRQIALEKLWDAFERIKTCHAGLNKESSVIALITSASEESCDFYGLLDAESKCLTVIGNTFRIRHHETYKIEITSDRHVDYLFYRMMSLINLLVRYI